MVILAKRADHAKSRLGLPPGEARRAALGLASCTTRTALSAETVSRVYVVTGDETIAADARKAGAHVVDEARPLGMNKAAALGRRHALQADPTASVAILVADLPHLHSRDIDVAVAEFAERQLPLFVPDRHGDGTTFLIHAADRLMGIAFGWNSAEMHRRLGYGEADRPGSGLRADLDTPEDLAETRRLLRS